MPSEPDPVLDFNTICPPAGPDDDDAPILLVEDTPSLARMYETFLTTKGLKIETVFTGRDAVDVLLRKSVRLILLDLRLPDLEGLDLMARLRETGASIPVIVITGNGSINTAIQAMRLGAYDFLVKPFNVERLHETVRWVLEEAAHQPGRSSGPEREASKPSRKQASGLPEKLVSQKSRPSVERAVEAGAQGTAFGQFIGDSACMQEIFENIECAALSQAPVFITGESGTGKEICAQAVHRHSPRARGPFVPVNCAAIPRELLESELFGHVKGAFTGAVADREGAVKQARGGTLFLDEIGEMEPDMQTKMLRFLQDLSYQKVGGSKPETADVRIICATNRAPAAEIASGRLRSDLYYRLYVIPLEMRPLRERDADIIALAEYFLQLYAAEEGKNFTRLSPEVEDLFRRYRWPGNVRELQNLIRRIVVMKDGEEIVPEMLPASQFANLKISCAAGGAVSAKNDERTQRPENVSVFPRRSHPGYDEKGVCKPLWKIEKEVIEQVIADCDGNIPRAAFQLEISPSTIYRKKMQWGEKESGL